MNNSDHANSEGVSRRGPPHPDDVDLQRAILKIIREEGGEEHLRATLEIARTFQATNAFFRKLFLAAVVLFGGITTLYTAWNTWIAPYLGGHKS